MVFRLSCHVYWVPLVEKHLQIRVQLNRFRDEGKQKLFNSPNRAVIFAPRAL